MPRTTYASAEKEHALRRCAEIGVPKASEELGITMASLYAWRRAAGKDKTSTITVGATDAPAEDKGISVSSPRRSRKISSTHTDLDEELIRLRVENAALKAQVLSLKNAVRAFAE